MIKGSSPATIADAAAVFAGYSMEERTEFSASLCAAAAKDKPKLMELRKDFSATKFSRSNDYIRDRIRIAQSPTAEAEFQRLLASENAQLRAQIEADKKDRDGYLNNAARTVATQFGNSTAASASSTGNGTVGGTTYVPSTARKF